MKVNAAFMTMESFGFRILNSDFTVPYFNSQFFTLFPNFSVPIFSLHDAMLKNREVSQIGKRNSKVGTQAPGSSCNIL